MVKKVGCKVMKVMMRIMTCTVQGMMIVMVLVMLLMGWVGCRVRRSLERARTAGVQWQST
jgi:hypothetical protein